MKYLLLLLLLLSKLLASPMNLTTFQADFIQTITDDKNKTLTYEGKIIASYTKNALWQYTSPVEKSVYLNQNKVTIIEPELEQVIIRHIKSNFNFFNMIKNAKKITSNQYLTTFNNVKFTITTKNKKIKTIKYFDEFENKVKIIFKNQKQNIKINNNLFLPKYNLDFDVIRD